MKVREARAEDLPAVLEIERACFGAAAWTEPMFAGELGRAGGVFLVLEAEGALAGHALGRVVADEAEVLEIGVSPASRRRGHARALLDALEAQLARSGARTCWLEVRADNAGAQSLYRSRGYEAVGRRPRYYPDGEDAILMARELPEAAALSC